MKMKQNLSLGILFMIFASLAYTLASIFVKLIGNSTSLSMILFFRYGLFLLFLIPIVIKKKAYQIEKHHIPIFIIRGLCGLTSIGLFFYAIQFVSLGVATVLATSTPLFVPLLLRIFRNIKIIHKLYWGLSLGLIGVIIVIHPNVHHIQLAMLIALGSALFRAGSSVSVRTLAKTYSPLTILFYYFLIGTVGVCFSLIFNFSYNEHFPWIYILLVAVFSAFYQLCLTNSLTRAPARLVVPLSYLAVVFAMIADWFLWKELPTLLMTLGTIFIITGIFLVIYLGKSAIENAKRDQN